MGNFMGGLAGGYADFFRKRPGEDGSETANRKKGLLFRRRTKKNLPGGGDTGGGSTFSGIPVFKRGGKMRKTGIAKLERGERVLTKKQSKKYNEEKQEGKKRGSRSRGKKR
jgi:hypothetical protein